jgi:WG containing repeat
MEKGVLSITGKQMIKPQFVDVFSNFTEGLALVSKVVKLKDEDGEYIIEAHGYIDKKGKNVIGFTNPDFGASPFSNGLAVVSDGGQYTYYIIANPLKSKGSSK